MYGLSAFANISSGAQSWRYAVRYNQRSDPQYFTWDRDCLRVVITFPFALLWGILVGIPSCMLSCLPNPMQQSIRFSGRVARKWGGHTTASAKIRLRQIPHRLPRAPHKEMGTDKGLETILVYDILLLIAPKLHYVDFVNLSMVSKRVRAAIFPASETLDKERELRLYSCYGNIKGACWICGIQICCVSYTTAFWSSN